MTENRMTHCPACSKPLLNSGQFSGCAEFSMRCPWCQATVMVEVQTKITATIKNSADAKAASSPVYGLLASSG